MLNFQEMWNLYLLLKPAIDNRELKELVLDEIIEIIDLSSPQALLECLHILYDNSIKFDTPMEFNRLFITGIRENDFFGFCGFIRGISGNSK